MAEREPWKRRACRAARTHSCRSPRPPRWKPAPVSLVADVRKLWGSGAEHGLNTPAGGASLNHATSAPGGPRELNGITASAGPSIGGDVHYFEGYTTERWSLSLDELKDAVRLGLPGIRRFGL